MTRKFRKKPVVIEAKRLTKANCDEVAEWCGASHYWIGSDDSQFLGLIVSTLEGEMQAGWGDWIIKGVKGEFYPCKPDIFEATYEAAE